MRILRRKATIKAAPKVRRDAVRAPADHFVKAARPVGKGRVGKLVRTERARRAKEGT